MRVQIAGVALLISAACSATSAPPAAARPAPARAALVELSESFEALSARVAPTVVEIFASGLAPQTGLQSSTTNLVVARHSLGSGVILTEDGYIITNHHVVRGATRLQVLLPAVVPGKSILKARGVIEQARLVGVDLETDLAVLKVEKKGLPVLALGDSDTLRAGQLVLAFGSPHGLDGSVSMGIVSAPARQLQPESPVVHVQTDAPINPGNSGGALVSARGELVGINTLIFTQSGGSEGLGFAVPSNIVKNVFDQLRRTGRVQRGIIGVHAQTITPELATGLALGRASGVVLADVYPGGPAAQAGLLIGDVVLALDGKPMENSRQLDVNVYRRSAGAQVSLTILRGKQERTVKVGVVVRDDDPNRFGGMVDPQRSLVRRLGILGVDLTPGLRRMFPVLRGGDGVIVAAAAADGPRDLGGLRPGDIIHNVNLTVVRTVEELRGVMDRLAPGSAAVVQLERDGRLAFVAFEVE